MSVRVWEDLSPFGICLLSLWTIRLWFRLLSSHRWGFVSYPPTVGICLLSLWTIPVGFRLLSLWIIRLDSTSYPLDSYLWMRALLPGCRGDGDATLCVVEILGAESG